MKKSLVRYMVKGLLQRHGAAARAIADPDVVFALLPASAFSGALTPSRRRDLGRSLLRMSQEQLQIVYSKGWDRGLLEKVEGGSLIVKGF